MGLPANQAILDGMDLPQSSAATTVRRYSRWLSCLRTRVGRLSLGQKFSPVAARCGAG